MTPTNATSSRTRPVPAHARATRAQDLLTLTKPSIIVLAMVTATGGAMLDGRPMAGWRLVATLVGTGLLVAAAAALNQLLERRTDALMTRTARRPLPEGRVTPAFVLGMGLSLGAAGALTLFAAVNALTAALGAFALVSYVLIYTPLKRRTSFALVVGAVPGALPALMGWTAKTGRIGVPGLVLFGILFLWQLPHFIAIASYLKEDYARGGIRVAPLTQGDRVARIEAVTAAAALWLVSLLLVPLGGAGPIYFVGALVLGAAFVAYGALGLRRSAGARWARSYFLASLAYLPALTGVLALDLWAR
ncbi:MAG TPA: heme o synthase [Polyangia bacterium]|jgi:protoheme IX farnesyltransferase